MNKPSILVFVDWYLPAYKGGGIITSLASVVKHLEKDYFFKIFTRNTDFGCKKPLESVVSDKWISFSANTQINYCSRRRYRFRNIVKEVSSKSYDVIYINSIFSFYFSIFPLIIIKFKQLNNYKVIIAPMGMLSPGALKFKKYKKILFLILSKFSGIYNNVIFHASSQMESDDILRVFGIKSKVFIASYLFNAKQLTNIGKTKNEGNARVAYISRICPKKNLLGVIRYLEKINKNLKIELGIFGPIEDKRYWNQCKTRIKNLPSNITCNYLGEIESKDVISTFQQFHFSILPTFSENYGQVIPESFAAGTPVILSDRTPWDNLEENSAGWVIPLDNDLGFIRVLENCAKMNQQTYEKLQNASYNYALRLSNDKEAIERLKQMFVE